MLLGACVAFTACDDNDTYEPAAKPTGAQVYFGSELPTAYEINPEENSITVTVSRANTEGSLTAPITATTESTKYSFPESVTFEDGASTASYVISYDPSAIEYGNYETITLDLNESQTTPYGNNTYTFTIGVTDWTDWAKWNDAGSATYIYNLYWSGDDPDLPFFYRKNIIKEGIYQFRIDNWGYGVSLVIDYDANTGNVTCARQYTGLEDASGYGNMYVADYTTYYVYRGYTPGADFDPVYGSFNEEEGIITIPMNYNVSAGSFGTGEEYIYIGGYVRADASCAVSYVGKLTAPDESTSLVANVTLGADVTSARVALVAGDLTEEIQAQILSGEYANMVEVTESGEVKFPATDLADGKYTFVVISYLGDEAREMATASFKYEAVASAWKSLGMATYTEDALGPLYMQEGDDINDYIVTYEVEIQENADDPGMYRLVNPYGAAYPFNEEGDWDTSRDYYFEINATDPDGVWFDAQEMGVDWGDGVFTIYSMAAYYMTKGYDLETIKANGFCGTLKDGVITFPVQGILCALGENGWYYGNQAGAFKVVLPEASESAKAKKIAKKDGKKHMVRRAVNQKPVHPTPLLSNSFNKAPFVSRFIK